MPPLKQSAPCASGAPLAMAEHSSLRYRRDLAQALGHAAARQGHDVLFITPTQLMSSLRTAQVMATYERRFNYLAKVPRLLIGDFGLKLRPTEDEDFHDLIAERYERTATVLTSNLDLEEWGAAFPANKTIAAATLDRLRHGDYKSELDIGAAHTGTPCPLTFKVGSRNGFLNFLYPHTQSRRGGWAKKLLVATASSIAQ